MAEENKERRIENAWFISDLHVRHRNILKYSPLRIKAMGLKDEEDIDGHDEWIRDMWLSTVKRGDHVYVLGDFIMAPKEWATKYLHQLKRTGCRIHLILGNHDNGLDKLTNMFDSIDLIKVVDFKKTAFPFLDNDFSCVMCHYPMKSWPRKPHGTVNLYGHVHDNSPWIDADPYDLCLNVGLDSPFSNYGLIPLEKIYEWYKERLNGKTPEEYIKWATKVNHEFIR